MRGLGIAGVLVLALGCTPAEPAPIASTQSAAIWQPVTKLMHPSSEVGDDFGAALAADGPRLFVGASQATVQGMYAGTALVFVANGSVWTLEQELSASDAKHGMQFGVSVDIQGDTALVGASSNGSGGAVYVFT